MDSKMQEEIKQMEEAGITVVATQNGKLIHNTGGINEDSKFCDSCKNLEFRPDPDEDDWFRDEDQKAVCLEMLAVIRGGLERPSEMVNIEKPLWCSKLGRELTQTEKKMMTIRLSIAKEDF